MLAYILIHEAIAKRIKQKPARGRSWQGGTMVFVTLVGIFSMVKLNHLREGSALLSRSKGQAPLFSDFVRT